LGQTIKALEDKVTKLEATGATERAFRTQSRVAQLEFGATKLTSKINEAETGAEARSSEVEMNAAERSDELEGEIEVKTGKLHKEV
jgi:hypothetical protein